MKLKQMKNDSQGPSSAIGIMKFNETTKGPKISPEILVGITIGIIVLVLLVKASI